MQDFARLAIHMCRDRDLYIILDADALVLVGNDPDIIKGYRKAVITPNVAEFARLCERLVSASTVHATGTQLMDWGVSNCRFRVRPFR